jgi:hypothetical protein
MKTTSLLIALSTFYCSVAALGQNATVTTTSSPGLLQLAGSGVNGQILLSADDWWGVLRAAEDLAGDFGKVTGKNLTLANWQSSNVTKKRDVPTAPFNPPGGPGGFPYGPPLGNLPPSPGHNKTQSQGTSTTVYYTFNPVTSFINVSVHLSTTTGSEADLREVHRGPCRELHWPNTRLLLW